MDISTQIQNADKQTTILNRFTLGVLNTLMILLFIYTLFSSQYLPESGTGVVLSIISAFAIMYVAINVFIGGINVQTIKNMIKSLLMMDVTNDNMLQAATAKKEFFIFRMLNSAKMFYVAIISTALSVMFFKYMDLIKIHHSSIPKFDSFFTFIIFSLMSQTIYLSGMHFTYTKEILKKYLNTSYRSVLIFGILNLINLLFVASMFSELMFMPTDG